MGRNAGIRGNTAGTKRTERSSRGGQNPANLFEPRHHRLALIRVEMDVGADRGKSDRHMGCSHQLHPGPATVSVTQNLVKSSGSNVADSPGSDANLPAASRAASPPATGTAVTPDRLMPPVCLSSMTVSWAKVRPRSASNTAISVRPRNLLSTREVTSSAGPSPSKGTKRTRPPSSVSLRCSGSSPSSRPTRRDDGGPGFERDRRITTRCPLQPSTVQGRPGSKGWSSAPHKSRRARRRRTPPA